MRSTRSPQGSSSPSGKVTIEFLQPNDVQGAGLLLTRAFAGTPEAVRLDEAVSFMRAHVHDELEVTLVAKLLPSDPSLLPPGKPSRLVGVVSLSFSDAAGRIPQLGAASAAALPVQHGGGPQVQAARHCQSHARACGAAAQDRGQDTIWLHVRQTDAAAQQLYSSYGYSEVKRDPPAKPGVFGLLLGQGTAQAHAHASS
ncbi:hypothetical protein COO60DRAFT_351797 [Scenedesmus sp. NREL 46B-D3]|nr:hypothetical protein COO60DRAFT_351797 [Scenedesmus sp. NREL 46B-D3]